MSEGKNLMALLADIRHECADVPDEAWERIKRLLAQQAGTCYVYVPAGRRMGYLEALAQAGEEASIDRVAKIMGVSVRRAQQLRKLYG